MKKADVTFNAKARAALYVRAQHIALSDGAFITIGNGVYYYLINPKVHGIVGSAAYGFPVAKNDEWGNVTVSQ
jgi:ABC-type transport system substrate-binding protein